MSTCRHTLTALVGAACILGNTSAIATSWQQSISVPVTVESDSNPTLAPNNSSTRLRRTRIAPDYKLSGTFGIDKIGAGLALLVERSSDRIASLPRQDPSLFLNWQRATNTGEFGLSTKYQEASTSSSELSETGLIVRDGTRKTQTLSGNWNSSLSERSSLAATADHTSVTYDSGSLTDYSNTILGLNYNYALSERIEPFFRVSKSRYTPKTGIATSSNNTTLTGGLKIKVLETLELTSQAGTSKISNSGRSILQGSLALRYTGQDQTATLEISRGSSASGTGGFLESDSMKGSWAYTITSRTQSGLDISRVNSKSALPNTMNQVGAWINRELSPHWNARFNFQYRLRQQSGSPNASSDMLGLNLIYSHPNF